MRLDKIREVTRAEKSAKKQTDKVLKLMKKYKQNGLLSKKDYEKYKQMIDEKVEVVDNAKEN